MKQTDAVNQLLETKVADLIIRNHAMLLVLEHFNVSLPVQEKTVADLCTEFGINPDMFLAFIHLFEGMPYSVTTDYSHQDIITLIAFLKKSHQYYLDEQCPSLANQIEKLQNLNTHREIAMVRRFFDDYLAEVTEHLAYENDVVFPYILRLAGIVHGSDDPGDRGAYSVNEYKNQHNDIEEKLADMRNLLIRYLPTERDQVARRDLLFALRDFEKDLHVHSCIEDTILIPLVEKMEAQLKERVK